MTWEFHTLWSGSRNRWRWKILLTWSPSSNVLLQFLHQHWHLVFPCKLCVLWPTGKQLLPLHPPLTWPLLNVSHGTDPWATGLQCNGARWLWVLMARGKIKLWFSNKIYFKNLKSITNAEYYCSWPWILKFWGSESVEDFKKSKNLRTSLEP